jgi:8-oxo-dGTP pyrophosphatase MutT (NUDIX family)
VRIRWPRRRAARVVLLDGDDRVLLFRLDPAHDPDGLGYWYLPGGGIFPFESEVAAALRELREETGLADVLAGGVIGRREEVRFVYRGRRMVQDECYVAARLVRGGVEGGGAGAGRSRDRERASLGAWRWWAADDLAAATETIHPPELGALVEAAAAAVGSSAGTRPRSQEP